MRRNNRLALMGILIGFVIGVAASLYYAWQINPVILKDVSPYQLSKEDKRTYLIAISMAYAKDHDAVSAGKRIVDLRMNWQDLADTACDLVQTGYAKGGNTNLIVIRSMVSLVQSQGKTSCAAAFAAPVTSTPIPTVIVPTDTLVPPPSKTPTLGVTYTPPGLSVTPPTSTPASNFQVIVKPGCDASGIISIFAQDAAGVGTPGVAIEVTWGTNDKNDFFTGLKPEIDNGYASFQTTDGESYTVALRDQGEHTQPLRAGACTGGQGKLSYQVIFRRNPSH